IEGQLRKSLQLSAGDPAGLLGEPIAVSIYIILALILAWPLIFKLVRRNRPAAAGPAPAAPDSPAGSSAHADLPVHPDGTAHQGPAPSDSSVHPDKKETP
ncbi:MAG: tripartite tricarboxylate transporter permease, partial [Pseudarthrobacter sp.]